MSNTKAAKRSRPRTAKAASGTRSTARPSTSKRGASNPSATTAHAAKPRVARSQAATAADAQLPGATPARGGPADEPAHRWTFLTNHAHVLIVLHGSGNLVLREVARRVGITERAVQRIVQDLEQEGFIRRQKVGRKNQYEVLMNRPLRHPLEAHRDIGDLLTLISER